jgi:hypothetical protein
MKDTFPTNRSEALKEIYSDARRLAWKIVEIGNIGDRPHDERLLTVFSSHALAIQTITEYVITTTGDYMESISNHVKTLERARARSRQK